MGSDEDWELATNGLRNALEEMGLDYIVNEGDGAFYGPKIDFHLRFHRTYMAVRNHSAGFPAAPAF